MIRQLLTFTTLALALGFTAHAQTAAPAAAGAYPSKPVRLIVPFPPGGGTDILSRLVATRLTDSAKWTVVADNKAGAGGTIGIGEAVKAAPTGYDLVMGQKDNMVVGSWLYKNLPWDPTKVNPNGSGISLGHPVGATGAIITTKAIAELHRTGGRYALVTMCIGGGQGIAAIYERV